MASPAQMVDHELNPIKGWPGPAALDKSKAIHAGETIQRGRVMSIDPVFDEFVLGAPDNAMPIFAFPSSADFDVYSDDGNMSGGHGMGLVATGGFEVETTEYLGTSFAPNTPLTTHNDADSDKGKVKECDFCVFPPNKETVCICGIVSDAGPLTNEFRKTVVRFWTVYLPDRVADCWGSGWYLQKP